MENTMLIILISINIGLLLFTTFIQALEVLLNVIRNHKSEMSKLPKVEEPMFKYETTKVFYNNDKDKEGTNETNIQVN